MGLECGPALQTPGSGTGFTSRIRGNPVGTGTEIRASTSDGDGAQRIIARCPFERCDDDACRLRVERVLSFRSVELDMEHLTPDR
jgi:hypothetical protein